MAAESVPTVLIPRYSSFVGDGTYTWSGLVVSAFATANLSVWRGKLQGTSPTFALTFQESNDQDAWTACDGVPAPIDPGADKEETYSITLSKRYFRLELEIGGTNPAAVCYVSGFFFARRP